MNGTYLLLEDLKNTLTAEFSQMVYRQPLAKGQATDSEGTQFYRIPSVFIGHLPTKRSMPGHGANSTDEDFPYVLIRPVDGEITGESPRAHTVKVAILCGIFTAEQPVEAGYHDIQNMLDTVVTALSYQRFWADSHWAQKLPIRWVQGLPKELSIYEAGLNEHPYYGGVVFADFESAAVTQRPPKEVDEHEPEKHPY